MEEFKEFESEENSEKNNERNTFKSDLGNFTHLQDRIILFGQSYKMLILTGLIVLGFILTTISAIILIAHDLTIVYNGQVQNQNWVKITLIISIVLTLFIPLGFVFITYGARKIETKYILKGISTIETFVNISAILLVLSGILFAVFSIILLFMAFILGIITILILGAFYYFFFKFLNKSKDVLYDLSSAFTSNQTSNIYPETTKLNVFLL